MDGTAYYPCRIITGEAIINYLSAQSTSNIMLPEPDSIPERVHYYRIRCGYTQQQLAQEINVTSSIISNIENGRSEVGIERFIAMGKAMEIHPAQLAFGSSNNPSVPVEWCGFEQEYAALMKYRASDQTARDLAVLIRVIQ